MSTTKILTLDEAAERLRISKHTLYNWLQDGKDIRRYAFKMGDRKWAFQESDLDAFIHDQRQKSLEGDGVAE